MWYPVALRRRLTRKCSDARVVAHVAAGSGCVQLSVVVDGPVQHREGKGGSVPPPLLLLLLLLLPLHSGPQGRATRVVVVVLAIRRGGR